MYRFTVLGVTKWPFAAYLPMEAMRRRVGLIPIAAALVVASAGCGSSHHIDSGPPSASAAASCAAAVEWQGATYFGTKVNQPARLARDLGTGTRPACDDGGGSTAASSVRLSAIAGVPPEKRLQSLAIPLSSTSSPVTSRRYRTRRSTTLSSAQQRPCPTNARSASAAIPRRGTCAPSSVARVSER